MHDSSANHCFNQTPQMTTLQENQARQHQSNDRLSLVGQNDGHLGKFAHQNPMDRQQHQQQDQMLFHGQHHSFNPNMYMGQQDVNSVQQQMIMQNQLCQSQQQMYDLHQSAFEEQ